MPAVDKPGEGQLTFISKEPLESRVIVMAKRK